MSDNLYQFASHTFTTANKIGPIGPTLNEIRSAYSSANSFWAQNTDFLNMKQQGIQEWTVPATGIYTIRAAGAKGGDSYDMNGNINRGGKGVSISTETTLYKGEIIKILVGQIGISSKSHASGGGGGTFVVRDTKTPIIVAGGGGGATSDDVLSWMNNRDIKTGGNGVHIDIGGGGGKGQDSNMVVKPGENGNGATMTVEASEQGYGGQGGGLLSNGTNFC